MLRSKLYDGERARWPAHSSESPNEFSCYKIACETFILRGNGTESLEPVLRAPIVDCAPTRHGGFVDSEEIDVL